MKKNVKVLLMSLLTCIALSPVFAESNSISFDDKNCVILSDGSIHKISIPVPSGWTNMYEDPENADAVRELDKQQDPLNDTNAHYLNPDGLWNEALVKVNKKLRLQPIRHSMFLKIQEGTIKEIDQNTIATTILKNDEKETQNKIPENMKELLKQAKFLPVHVKDKRSLQFTSIFPFHLDEIDLIGVSTGGLIWMHGRIFSISVKSFVMDESKINEQIEQTREFVRQWIEAICRINKIDTEDTSNIVKEDLDVMVETMSMNDLARNNSTHSISANYGSSTKTNTDTILGKVAIQGLIMMIIGGIASAFTKKKQDDKTVPLNEKEENQ